MVGEMAYMKRRKVWKMGEDGLCCSSSAIQTRLGPSSLLEERSEISIVLLFLLCCRLPPNWGKRPRYRHNLTGRDFILLLVKVEALFDDLFIYFFFFFSKFSQ